MEDLKKELQQYMERNTCTLEDCAKKLNLDISILQGVIDGTAKLTSDEITKISESMRVKKGGKRLVKILDLLFRFGATIMGLVVLLLCINGYSELHTLIALLSIGVVCSAFTMLPKIDK